MEKLNIIKKISSKYILTEIFSFINYNRTKNLVKYNLKLREKLNIKLEDYSLTFNYSEREIKEPLPSNLNEDIRTWRIILIVIIVIINIMLYIGIATGLPGDNSEKWPKLKIILNYVFYFFLFALFPISFFCMVCPGCHYSRSCVIFMVIINFLNIIGLILNIMKIIVDAIYQLDMFMINLICDIFVLILFPFLIILYFIYISKCKDIIRGYRLVLKIIINEYRGFKVDDYFLDIDFKKKKKEEQKEILINSKFTYTLSEEQKELIESINEFRLNNNLEPFRYNTEEDLDDYFVIINTKKFPIFKNIFEIDGNKYLFIYPINEFKNNFENNDINILNILKTPTLNQILIIENKGNQHIFVYNYWQLYRSKTKLKNNINKVRETERSIDLLNNKNI